MCARQVEAYDLHLFMRINVDIADREDHKGNMLRHAMNDQAEMAVATSPESRGGEVARLIYDSGLLTLTRWDQALELRAQPCSQPSGLAKHSARRPSAPPSGREERSEQVRAGRATDNLRTGAHARRPR